MNADEDPRSSVFLTEQPLHDLVAFLERRGQVFGLVAAAFGHVGFAAATTADDWCELFNYLSGRNLARQVRGRAHDQRHLAVTASSEHDHARLNAREQRV